jgi:micrococcal nuclease
MPVGRDAARMIAAVVFLAMLQTDFGVRTPPGEPSGAPSVPGVAVVRPKHSGAFTCAVRSVADGDTFRCSSGVRVRLAAIDAPEMPGSCQQGRNCAPGSPYAARDALRRLIGGRTVQCEPVGRSYGRIVAWCMIGGMDLSCAMVRSGHSIRYARHDRDRRLCR